MVRVRATNRRSTVDRRRSFAISRECEERERKNALRVRREQDSAVAGWLRPRGQPARQMGCTSILADIELASAESRLTKKIAREGIVGERREPAQKRSSFITIDSPSSLDRIVINALVAADEVLAPFLAELLTPTA